MNQELQQELDDLCGMVRDGTIDPVHFARLHELLEGDRDARRHYVQYMAMCASLRGYDLAGRAPEVSLDDCDSEPESSDVAGDIFSDALILPAIRFEEQPHDAQAMTRQPVAASLPSANRRRHSRRQWGGLAAAILLSAGILVYVLNRRPASFAVLQGSVQAEWSSPVAGGSRIGVAPLHLKSGVARLLLDGGAVVIVEAPAEFSIPAASRVRLMQGRLTAVAPQDGRGMEVATPSTQVLDLGTEFGVDAGPSATDVRVFKGHVRVAPVANSRAGNVLEAGEGRHVESDGVVTASPLPASAFVTADEFAARLQAEAGSAFDRWRAWSHTVRRQPGLVAYYTFGNGQTDAAALEDESGGGHAGRLGDGRPGTAPTWTTGRWPQKGALSFDAKMHQCVVIPHDPALNLAGAITIAAWLKPADMTRSAAHIFNKVESDPRKTFNFNLHYDMQSRAFSSWCLYFGGFTFADTRLSDSVLPRTSQWLFVAVSSDPAGNTCFYLNGVPIGVSPHAVGRVLTDADVWMGCSHWVNNEDFDGQIDELALFNRVLNPSEIRNFYEAGKP